VDMSFAPCIDIDYGVSRAIGDRALHPDAAAVAELGVAYMQGHYVHEPDVVLSDLPAVIRR